MDATFRVCPPPYTQFFYNHGGLPWLCHSPCPRSHGYQNCCSLPTCFPGNPSTCDSSNSSPLETRHGDHRFRDCSTNCCSRRVSCHSHTCMLFPLYAVTVEKNPGSWTGCSVSSKSPHQGNPEESDGAWVSAIGPHETQLYQLGKCKTYKTPSRAKPICGRFLQVHQKHVRGTKPLRFPRTCGTSSTET